MEEPKEDPLGLADLLFGSVVGVGAKGGSSLPSEDMGQEL